MAKKMELELIYGRIILSIAENGNQIIYKDLEFIII